MISKQIKNIIPLGANAVKKVFKMVTMQLTQNCTKKITTVLFFLQFLETDRISCEISTTLNLGGDIWPIFFKIKKEIKVELKPGDMVLYLGEQIPHWRKIFKGNICGQVFLHYNTKQRNNLAADGRPFVGLPYPYRKDTDGTR